MSTAQVHPVNDLVEHQLGERAEAARQGDGWFVTPVGAEVA